MKSDKDLQGVANQIIYKVQQILRLILEINDLVNSLTPEEKDKVEELCQNDERAIEIERTIDSIKDSKIFFLDKEK